MSNLAIRTLLGPKDTDVQYEQNDRLKIPLLLRLDSYKFAHPFAYPTDIEIVGMSSYGTARVDASHTIVPAGLQMLIKDKLTEQITAEDVDAAEKFALAHFGRPLFRRKAWDRIVSEFNGYLPLVIRAVPEGTRVRGGQAIYSVTAFGKDFFWLSSGFETLIQRGVWYPTTIASMDYSIHKDIKALYERTGADMSLLPFSLHDFGARGVSCAEQAQIGGAAHTFNFMGSDTVEGILTANFYYKSDMAAFSVFATEHSVECAFGNGTENALRYLRHQLKETPEGAIVSIVIDGYDVYREAELLCTVMKDEIIASKAKVVFRPDSGDMEEVVPRILRLQATAFGTTINAKGFKKVNNVGIIQGDGVDHKAIRNLLGRIAADGFSADNVIFGSGGALLQKVNRDTFKFAQKASAILVRQPDGTEEWIGIAKDPVTDQGKKSKEGVLTLVRSKVTGELMDARLDQGPLNEEFEDVHKLVYYYGKLYNETTLDEIRARIQA